MPGNHARKPPTDFTIDCILSTHKSQNCEQQKSPTINYPMNKVLDNPWISKCPSALTFNPSSHRKHNFPSSPLLPSNCFSFFNPQITTNYNENILKVAQHFTPVKNTFYPPSATSTSSDTTEDFKAQITSSVYENNNFCDNKTIRNSLILSKSFVVKDEIPSSEVLSSIYKCSVCSKTFENSEILDVSRVLELKCQSD